jgi:cell division protein FtsQ
MVFYEQVLSKTGFDRYKLIDVQYKGQVVATRSTGNAKVDSIQLRRNVEKLLKLADEAEKDTVIKALPLVKLESDSAIAPDPSLQDAPEPVPVKKQVPKKPVKKTEEKKTPKAVMPKRTDN